MNTPHDLFDIALDAKSVFMSGNRGRQSSPRRRPRRKPTKSTQLLGKEREGNAAAFARGSASAQRQPATRVTPAGAAGASRFVARQPRVRRARDPPTRIPVDP